MMKQQTIKIRNAKKIIGDSYVKMHPRSLMRLKNQKLNKVGEDLQDKHGDVEFYAKAKGHKIILIPFD